MSWLNMRVVLLLISIVALQNLLVNHFHRGSCPQASSDVQPTGRITLAQKYRAADPNLSPQAFVSSGELTAVVALPTSQSLRSQPAPSSPLRLSVAFDSQPLPSLYDGKEHSLKKELPYVSQHFLNGSLEWRKLLPGGGIADPDGALSLLSGQLFRHADYGPLSQTAPVCRYLDVKCVVHAERSTCMRDGGCGWCVDKALCIDKRVVVSRDLCSPDPGNLITADAPHWKKPAQAAILLENRTFRPYTTNRRTHCTNIVIGFFMWFTLASQEAILSNIFLIVWPEAYKAWKNQPISGPLMHFVFSGGPVGHHVGLDLLSLLSETCYSREQELPDGTCYVQYPQSTMRALQMLPTDVHGHNGSSSSSSSSVTTADSTKQGRALLQQSDTPEDGEEANDVQALTDTTDPGPFRFVRSVLGVDSSSLYKQTVSVRDAKDEQWAACLLQSTDHDGVFLNAHTLQAAAPKGVTGQELHLIAISSWSTAVEIIRELDRCRLVLAANKDVLAWALFARPASHAVFLTKLPEELSAHEEDTVSVSGMMQGTGGRSAFEPASQHSDDDSKSPSSMHKLLVSWLERQQVAYRSVVVPQTYWVGADLLLPAAELQKLLNEGIAL